jgi:hypothetical protein
LVYTKEQRTAIVVAIVYFVIYMLTSFSSRNSGRFSQIFHNLNKPLNLTLLLGLLFGLISGLLYENQGIIISSVFFIGIYLIENLRKPIGISYVADTVNKDILATVLSAESQAHTIISAIMAPLLGFMADNMGLGYSVMVLSGMLILLFPVFILRMKKK